MIKFGNTYLKFGNDFITDVYDTNPLRLPWHTIRIKYARGFVPTEGDTQTLVDAQNNIWDLYIESNDWGGLYDINYYLYPTSSHHQVLEVLGANSEGITGMNSMFQGCESLSSVALFDTSNVSAMGWTFWNNLTLTAIPPFNTSKVTTLPNTFTNCRSITSFPNIDTFNVSAMGGTFAGCYKLQSVPTFDTSKVVDFGSTFETCSALTSVPLLDVSKATNADKMFSECVNVTTGAYDLYQRFSAVRPVPNHNMTFYNCGLSSDTGIQDLMRIPINWTMPL